MFPFVYAYDIKYNDFQAAQIRTLMNLARNGSNFVNTELVLSLSQKTNENLNQMASKSSMTNALRQCIGSNKTMALNPYQKQFVASSMLVHSVPCISESTDIQQNLHLKQNPLKLLPLLKKSSNPASLYRLLWKSELKINTSDQEWNNFN